MRAVSDQIQSLTTNSENLISTPNPEAALSPLDPLMVDNNLEDQAYGPWIPAQPKRRRPITKTVTPNASKLRPNNRYQALEKEAQAQEVYSTDSILLHQGQNPPIPGSSNANKRIWPQEDQRGTNKKWDTTRLTLMEAPKATQAQLILEAFLGMIEGNGSRALLAKLITPQVLKQNSGPSNNGLQLNLDRSGNFILKTDSLKACNLLVGTQSASHPFNVLWTIASSLSTPSTFLWYIHSEREINVLMAMRTWA
ncbi:unnamed protein product [Ilex paraguariensis]|uniref:Uncharacterized protein n=1 Tax=Ilex paraguariensis TaxID=185542 RepID=A0ABC8QQP8_9AQUA